MFTTFLTPEIGFGTSEDLAINKILKLWTNFAEEGNPNSSRGFGPSVEWNPSTKKDFRLLHLGSDIKMESFPLSHYRRMWFWDTLYKSDIRTKYL